MIIAGSKVIANRLICFLQVQVVIPCELGRFYYPCHLFQPGSYFVFIFAFFKTGSKSFAACISENEEQKSN